jgi:DNA gyrase inhibitor GyrI
MTTRFEIKEIEQKDLVYIPTIGVDNNPASFEILFEWLCKNGILKSFDPAETEFITIYSDFKNTEMKKVDENKIKLKACANIDQTLTKGLDIETTEIQSGKYVVGKFEISNTPLDFTKSWKQLLEWTNKSGFKKDNREPFDLYRSWLNEDNVMKADLYYPIQ